MNYRLGYFATRRIWAALTWEIVTAIAALTVLRVAWIMRHSVPRDVPAAIMPGLAKAYKVIKRDRNHWYVPYGAIWYAMNFPLGRIVKFDGRLWMISLALIDGIFIWISQKLGLYGVLAYVLIGTFKLFRAPWNVSILWLIILGLFQWWFLILAR